MENIKNITEGPQNGSQSVTEASQVQVGDRVWLGGKRQAIYCGPSAVGHDYHTVRLVLNAGKSNERISQSKIAYQFPKGLRKVETLYRTTYTLVVLSDEVIPPDLDIAGVIEECNIGGYVLADTGSVRVTLTGKEMADALYRAGSDPEFFNLDDEGNEVAY